MLNYMADPGDEAVDSSSSSSLVRVHSALQDDGSVAVMILNTGTSAADVDVMINGGPLSQMGTLYSTTGAGITMSEMTGLGNAFSVAGMPGRTNYLFVIPAVPEPTSLILAAVGLAAALPLRKRDGDRAIATSTAAAG